MTGSEGLPLAETRCHAEIAEQQFGCWPLTRFWRDPALPFVEGHRASNSRACYRAHSHPTLSIGVVDRGRSRFQCQERRELLVPGCLVSVPAGVVHAWLFALLHAQGTPWGVQGLYALWMVGMVLGWDLLIGHMASHPRLIRRFGHGLRHIERLAGALLILLALGLIAARLDLAAWPAS